MTQFQQSASVRTLDTPQRAYTAPFLAIVAGLIAVLMAVALISFAVDARPSGRGRLTATPTQRPSTHTRRVSTPPSPSTRSSPRSGRPISGRQRPS